MGLGQYRLKLARHFNRSTLIIILLAACLIAAGSLIIYQRYAANRASQQLPAVSQNNAQSYKAALTSFLILLKSSSQATKSAHRDLYNYLRSLDKSNFPSSQEIKQFAEANDIPKDYQYFFRECLPNYSRSLNGNGTIFNDPNIILSLPQQAKYKASVILNSNNLPVESMYQVVSPQGSPNRIVVSGAYTSPYNLPAGLVIDKGEVINPAVQDFDGLLEIWPDGRIQITHINALQNDLRTLRIKTSFSDYTEFMKIAEQAKLTILQSNLLINGGELLVKDEPSLKKLQRRVIFQTVDGGLHIYDSLGKEQTLFETAQYLKEHYSAERAINLETGTYSFCTIYKQNQLINRSNIKPGTIISNFIIIDF